MKICSPQLGMSSNSSLGGEIYDYQTIKGFSQKGIDVFVYLPKGRPYDKSIKNLHVKYCFITHIIPPWLYSIICLPYLFRTYKKEKFDVLRIHSPRFLGLAAIIFHLLNPKVPILSSQVTVDPSPLSYPIEWLTFKISKKIIVQSEYMKNVLAQKYNVPRTKIAVTYGGQLEIPQSTSITPPEADKLGRNDPTILFMGVLVSRKNPLFLVDILKSAKSKIKNLKLVIIGNGPQKNKLISKLKKENLASDSIIINSAYGEEKAYWLNRMNVFLMPSQDEAFGLSVTEAMSFAKPVVTSAKAAFDEIITNGENGYTLPLDPDIWAKTITNLIQTPALSKKIGQAAQKTVNEEFNWQKTFDLNYQVVKEMTA